MFILRLFQIRRLDLENFMSTMIVDWLRLVLLIWIIILIFLFFLLHHLIIHIIFVSLPVNRTYRLQKYQWQI